MRPHLPPTPRNITWDSARLYTYYYARMIWYFSEFPGESG